MFEGYQTINPPPPPPPQKNIHTHTLARATHLIIIQSATVCFLELGNVKGLWKKLVESEKILLKY